MARRSWSARDIIDLTAFHGARVVLTAASLGVFEALSGRRATASAVAKRTACDPGAMARLLGVLGDMGLLRREGTKYGLAPGVRDLVTRDGPRSLADLLQHRASRFAAWERLEESLRSGRPVARAATATATAEEAALGAARARRDTARLWAPVMAQAVELGPSRTLLVMGSGATIHASHFARTRPKLRVTVVDGGASLAVGREYLLGRPEAKRIRLLDATPEGPWALEGRVDAAYLTDAIHGLPPEGVRRLLKRVRKALSDGGRLFLRDRFLAGRGTGDLSNALYDLELLLVSEGGRCHDLREVSDWIRAAGFRGLTQREVGIEGEFRVLCARV